MSVWFPFGFEQSRAAHDAAKRLRQAFPSLKIDLHDGRIEISGIARKRKLQFSGKRQIR